MILNRKQKLKRVINIMLVLLVMVIIFIFSSESGGISSNTSGKTIRKLLLLFKRDWQINELNSLVEILQPIARKMAHFGLYTLVGFFTYNIKYKKIKSKNIVFSFIVGFIYAMLDELHQILVPGRAGRIFGVFIDSLGVITGIIIYIVIERIINIIYSKNSHTCVSEIDKNL